MALLPPTYSPEVNSARQLPRLTAWRNVLAATGLAWLVIALPNFGFLTDYLARTMPENALRASLYLGFGFYVSMVVVIGLVWWWQRAHGETLKDLGWGRPFPRWVLVVAIVYGALWASTAYFQPSSLSFSAFPWERLIMAPLCILPAIGEELLFRGFIMEQLRRASVPTWVQVLVSAVAIASYHGLLGFSYSLPAAIFSIFIFGVPAILYVLGKRSLTPSIVAHAMPHLFGDPSLMMGILAAVPYI